VTRERFDYIILELDVSQEHKLYDLLDSGEDISLVKSYKLLGTAEVEPKDRVRVKSLEGSVMETNYSIQTRIQEREIDIHFRLQLVSQQVDLTGDGILGRDFLKLKQARICYRERSLTFQHEWFVIHKELRSLQESEIRDFQEAPGGKLTLPARKELIVKLPVSAGSRIDECLVEKAEITSGLYWAESLVKVNSGHIITSILNNREQAVELSKPVVKLVELRDREVGVTCNRRGRTREM
jgi:hypothetical protein